MSRKDFINAELSQISGENPHGVTTYVPEVNSNYNHAIGLAFGLISLGKV